MFAGHKEQMNVQGSPENVNTTAIQKYQAFLDTLQHDLQSARRLLDISNSRVKEIEALIQDLTQIQQVSIVSYSAKHLFQHFVSSK